MAESDEARFEDLYRRYRRHVHAYLARRTASDVGDLVAEVFLVAWRKIDTVPSDDAALFWLYRVAFRVLNHRWRGHRRRGRAMERLNGLVGVETDQSTDFIVVQREEYRLVREAASRLGLMDQEILRLTLWEELAYRDVAEILDIEVGAVKQRAHRARQRLGTAYREMTKGSGRLSPLGKEVTG